MRGLIRVVLVGLVIALVLTCTGSLEKEHEAFRVVRVRPGEGRVRMAWKGANGVPYRTIEMFRKAHPEAVVVMNGGIFDKGYSPAGLYVEEGKELVELNFGDGDGNFYLKPNGVFWVGQDGRCGVVESSMYSEQGVMYAVQSGPLLVARGSLHPRFQKESENRRVRNAVGVTAEGVVVFVVSKKAVTFWDLAVFMRDKMQCPDALYLDGDLSEMWAGKGETKALLSTMIWVEEKKAGG